MHGQMIFLNEKQLRGGLTLPDYAGGLLSVVNAWRSELGLTVHQTPDAGVKQWLQQFNQIAVLLIDGMGSRIIDRLDEACFLRSHLYKEVTTVYPSTTAAATTSIMTGLPPAQTGWIGWHQYFKELDDSLVLFLNQSYYGTQRYPGYSYAQLPFLNQSVEMERNGSAAAELYPVFRPHGAHDFAELCDQIAARSQAQDVRLIYAYWDQLDTLMHHEGPSSHSCTVMLEMINAECERLASRLDNRTGLIILADHGQLDVRCHNLKEDPELLECLRFLPTAEPRGTAFHVKAGQEAEFAKRFEKKYGQTFLLKKSADWLQLGLFGPGPVHPRTLEFIGDYFAAAVDADCLGYWEADQLPFKGQHAGLRSEEMMIPIILAQKEG